MRFYVVSSKSNLSNVRKNVVYLREDNWNDWFKFVTQFFMHYVDGQGEVIDIGQLKIGQFSMKEKQVSPEIEREFEFIGDQFFSLGQDDSYYADLMTLPNEVGLEILNNLNDVALNQDLFQRALGEEVTQTSLLRSVNVKTIEGQFRRIVSGGARLEEYQFGFVGPKPKQDVPPVRLHFSVVPDSLPPTNIHVLIGRNGVGKTHVMNAMARSFAGKEENPDENGNFFEVSKIGKEKDSNPFANMISVSFSAFDDFEIIPQRRNAARYDRYVHVGLRKRVKNDDGEYLIVTQDPEQLTKEFSESAKLCVRGVKLGLWKRALETLESDPLFAEAEVSSLAELEPSEFARTANRLYKKMSSGHKIVLLTITKLVENVEEKTLVLLDEPESHLHPPLFSAFVRALSDLLINRNGVAIVATHSPVVLQEVPKSCVWKLSRYGAVAKAERPNIETFAENVGVLTNEVFGLEVTHSGFHKMIGESISNDDTEFEDVAQKFERQIGSEGRALISMMLNNNGKQK